MLDTQVLLDSPASHAGLLPTPFTCEWTNDGHDAAWIRMAGELDIATAPQFERTLSEAQGQARLVVADLRQVAFADSTAMHALVNANTRAQRDGTRLVVLRGPPEVDRIFALSRVSEVVEIIDLDAAAPPVMALLRLATAERRGDDRRAP